VLTLRSPTHLRLPGINEGNLPVVGPEFEYVDKKVDYALRKFKSGSTWFIRRQGEHAYKARLAELQAARKPSLLFRDDQGFWTYSGLKGHAAEVLDDDASKREYDLPEPRLVAWSREPDKSPRYYQLAAEDALVEAAQSGPAAVEIGTGLGKTFIILRLLRRLGLPAVVMSPSLNIAEQIYDEMVLHFGKAKVGFFGDGTKEFKKLFTVAVGASLTKIAEGSPAWRAFSAARVFIADESHMCPAQTLTKVCFGLMANAPYRFFFSGTQIRNDGLGLLLSAITGPIVYRLTVREGVDQGFLSKPVFRMCWTKSNVNFDDDDVNQMTRAHIYYNPELNRKAADLANKAVSLMGRPTVILVDEFEQLSYLLPHLRYEARFAHGGVTKANKDKIPAQFHSSNPKELVEAFNAGEYPILIGTSCIATGTDIKAAAAILYLRGGKSEIEVKQSVGRGTRIVPGKTDCIFIDFGISNVETLKRHALARKELYDEIYPSYSELTI
jgi:superfamily II DNA or RNA helicase